jgi:alpha-glucosidase (family GH31 glycosyl hydrolase)
VGTEGLDLFVAAPSGDFDLSGERGLFQPRKIQSERHPNTEEGTLLDLFILDARQPAQLMAEQRPLTGAAALPPRWAFVYMQSYRTLESTEQMLSIAREFRRRKLPGDAMIYLGTGFCKKGWNVRHDSIEFNPELFKEDPASIISAFHRERMRVGCMWCLRWREPLFSTERWDIRPEIRGIPVMWRCNGIGTNRPSARRGRLVAG